MNIKIRSVNFDLTPAIHDYVDKKISSLDKFLDNAQVLSEVEIGRTTKHHKSGDIFKAEINMIMPGYDQVYALAEESDLYTAIDVVRDEAEREIVSRKNRKNTMMRRGAARLKAFIKRIDIRKNR